MTEHTHTLDPGLPITKVFPRQATVIDAATFAQMNLGSRKGGE